MGNAVGLEKENIREVHEPARTDRGWHKNGNR